MSHSYSAIYLHVVFATHGREPAIPADRLESLCAYLGGIARNLGFHMISAGGTADHIHLLVAISPALQISTAVQKLKANSSRFMGKRFHWQDGYGVFSVSASRLQVVRRYIAFQKEHHRNCSFDDEFARLLSRHGLAPKESGAVR